MTDDNTLLGDNLTGFQHIGLPVTDMERSRAFYLRLGFKEAMYRELPTGDEHVKVSMLDLNGFVLELYQLTGEELEEIKSRSHGHVDHIALDVNDIQSALRAVRAAGFETLQDEPIFLPFWEKGIYYFNISGPDGERVEFNQRVK